MPTLFDDLTVGHIRFANRIVMAPMTRNRADHRGGRGPFAATYYAQRASAGLIISEGTQPSEIGQGYPSTPGLHSADQIAGRRRVTDAVHSASGQIFVQLMHAGRINHPTLHDGEMPVAPSAVRPAGQIFTGTRHVRNGMARVSSPSERSRKPLTISP